MTLHTRMMVTTPGIDPVEVFDEMRRLLNIPDDAEWWNSPDPNSDNKYRQTMTPGIHMEAAQGYSAWLWVDHWDGELSAEHEHDKYCYAWDDDGNVTTELECGAHVNPRGYVEVNFDTAYGFTEANGAGCGDLHAYLVAELGTWLDARDAGWAWYDESGDGWRSAETFRAGDRGTLGDPEVGRPGSTKPKQGRENRRDFWAYASLAIAADLANGGAS
jgi:hypothetical protein